MQESTTVFLFTDNVNWWFAEVLLRLGVGIFALVFGVSLLREVSKNAKSVEPKFVVWAAFALIWGIPWTCLSGLVFFDGTINYTRLLMAYEYEYHEVVEGNVKVIRAKTAQERGGSDVIEVGDIEFEIKTSVMTFGYDEVSCCGGVLKEGASVRIYYYDDLFPLFGSGRTILRIDLTS